MRSPCSAIRMLPLALFVFVAAPTRGAEAPAHDRIEDVIYGRKHGTALTLDVFKPRQGANGAAVIFMVSGGWFSAHEMINANAFTAFLERGYTVFAVVHGSQPKYAIPEAIDDVRRAVRFIRHHAGDYGIDPDRLGVSGGSAGGHLSLMLGTTGRPGDPKAKDPVDRESSRVQAVACFFPPTDFLNYGETGRDVFRALDEELGAFRAPFDFTELDPKTRRFVLITDRERRLQIARDISPAAQASADDAPALILHGDEDKLVPIQQAKVMCAALEAVNVPAKLVVKTDQGHGWPDWLKDMAIFADWFDVHLKPKAVTSRP